MTLSAALKRAARCDACNEPPEQIVISPDPSSYQLVVYARCHGNRMRFVVDELEGKDGRRFGHLAGRLGRLFSEDNNPDVLELLRANRNPWRFP